MFDPFSMWHGDWGMRHINQVYALCSKLQYSKISVGTWHSTYTMLWLCHILLNISHPPLLQSYFSASATRKRGSSRKAVRAAPLRQRTYGGRSALNWALPDVSNLSVVSTSTTTTTSTAPRTSRWHILEQYTLNILTYLYKKYINS